jgi:hypothetical protein
MQKVMYLITMRNAIYYDSNAIAFVGWEATAILVVPVEEQMAFKVTKPNI